jgi:hypothetical protein
VSIPLYHCTRSFQYLNICAKHDRTFILLLQKIDYLSIISTNFHFKSLIDKYKAQNQTINHLCLAKFVTNCDMKTCKKCKHSKITCWISFNFHKDPETIIKKYCSYLNLSTY